MCSNRVIALLNIEQIGRPLRYSNLYDLISVGVWCLLLPQNVFLYVMLYYCLLVIAAYKLRFPIAK